MDRQDDLMENARVILERRCCGDESQLSIVFTPLKRVFLEAPAGFGKTTAMAGRVCWLLASGKDPPPKRVLTLTFSVAAARRMRSDIDALFSSIPGLDSRCYENEVPRQIFMVWHGCCYVGIGNSSLFQLMPTSYLCLMLTTQSTSSFRAIRC